MTPRFIELLVILLIASMLALLGRALTKKIGFFPSLAVYIIVLGIGVFAVSSFTRSDLSCQDALVSVAIYLVLSIILALSMKIASIPLIEMCLKGSNDKH